jgi:hypothetical protein
MSKTTNKFSPEARKRVVDWCWITRGLPLTLDSRPVDFRQNRCSAHTLLDWVKKTEVDTGKRAGISTDVAEKLKTLERENRELRQANEILRKGSAYFAQTELDRPLKR